MPDPPNKDSDFAKMSRGFQHSSGRPLTRLEAARKIFYNGAPRLAENLHQRCIQHLKEHLEAKPKNQEVENEKRKVRYHHPSFMAAKLRVCHGHLRSMRLTEIENQVLIAGQENAVDGVRLQTFMDYDLTPPKVPRNTLMSPPEITLLERLIRDTSCRYNEKRT